MAEILNFENENFLGYLDNRWVLSNCILTSDGFLQINPKGTAILELTNEVQAQFAYMLFRVEFSGDSISPENNYKSNPTIYLREVYKDIRTNVINKTIVRALGFNTFQTSEKGYIDSTTFKTGNAPMSVFQIKITNETNSPLYIYKIEAYKSIDIAESQVTKITQSLIKEGAAQLFKVYHNDDAEYSLNGLGVFIQNSTYELKFKPTYYDGQMIAIETNYGQVVSVQHLVGEIDLGENTTMEEIGG